MLDERLAKPKKVFNPTPPEQLNRLDLGAVDRLESIVQIGDGDLDHRLLVGRVRFHPRRCTPCPAEVGLVASVTSPTVHMEAVLVPEVSAQ